MWFEISPTARHFILRQPVIHNGFAASAQKPEETLPVGEKFKLEEHSTHVAMHYDSPNRMCAFYKALLRLILQHYGEDAEIEEVECVNTGALTCEIHIRWAKADAA